MKTREEEIRQAAHEYINSDAVRPENMQLAYGDFMNGAGWADEHSKNPWRDAKKELPKEYENVIVMVDTNTPTCGYVENGKFILDADYLTGKVMCWMPIPQIEKGE